VSDQEVLSASVNGRIVHWRVNGVRATSTGDPLLALGLMPSMRNGSPLVVEEPVSKRLLESTAQIQRLLSVWDKRMKSVQIKAPTYSTSPHGEGVGLFFSGGVDSFYSLHTRRSELTHLVVIDGFDAAGRWSQVHSMAAAVAAAEDLELVVVSTNAREAVAGLEWLEYGHGAVLASVGLTLQAEICRLIVGSSKSPETLAPSGTHPELDPLWSTERITFEHDALVPRMDKTAAIAANPLAMQWLRVCWQGGDAYNCGRCEKCIRTLIGLELAGASGRCSTLPRTLDLRAVAALRHHPRSANRTAEQMRRAEASGHHELARALRTSLRRSSLRHRVSRVTALMPRRTRH
jgi:hypothetical protein